MRFAFYKSIWYLATESLEEIKLIWRVLKYLHFNYNKEKKEPQVFLTEN